MLIYILIFIISAGLSFSLTPLVKKLAYRLNAIDVPKDDRRVHKNPIPRMGGLAIFISFLIMTLLYFDLSKQIIGILLGSSIIVIMGIFDDIKALKPSIKLSFQIAAAIILIVCDIRIRSITIPFVNYASINIGWVSIPFTLAWVIGITNAINLIDGLDGLACGISMISALTLFVVSLLSQRYIAIILTLILAGACLGFLYYNFNPARIFMGDTGSQFLGFILAAISTQAAIKSVTTVAIIVPIMALGIPIFDTLFAMTRRKLNNRPIMEADRGHLHHRLLDKGISHRRTVLIMYGISVVMGAMAVFAAFLPTRLSYLVFFSVCIGGTYIAGKIGIFKNKS